MAFCTGTIIVASVIVDGFGSHFARFDLFDTVIGCTLPGSDSSLLRRFSIHTTTVTLGGSLHFTPADGLTPPPPNVGWASSERIFVPIDPDIDDPWDIPPAVIEHVPDGGGTDPPPGDPPMYWSPPIADAQSLTVYAEGSVPVTLTGTVGSAGGPLVFTQLTSPTHGTLTGTIPNFTYHPAANWIGHDSFTFRVTDVLNQSAPVTVNIDTYPRVDSLSPTEGPSAGGTPVTIVGVGLHDTATVTFGGIAATSVVVASNGLSLTCVSPAHVTGVVPVVVTGPNHTSSSAILATLYFFYQGGDNPDWVIGQWELHAFEMRARPEQTS